ncbi:hypothetical protein [Streptomyces sp. NPDC057579]|uniref:hypothetical protein n=1 Tax=Streptomyces sp. NPDC057579 TaxID=3346172 RepID=UPI0036776F77
MLVAGLVVGALGVSGLLRLAADRRERDRAASADDAASPLELTAIRRGVWSLGVLVLLWAAVALLLVWSLPWFARAGSVAFGIATYSLALAVFFTVMPAWAVRRLLSRDLAAVRSGSLSAAFLGLWALAYVGNDWAGGSHVRAAVALVVAGVASGVFLVLERLERRSAGTRGGADDRAR